MIRLLLLVLLAGVLAPAAQQPALGDMTNFAPDFAAVQNGEVLRVSAHPGTSVVLGGFRLTVESGGRASLADLAGQEVRNFPVDSDGGFTVQLDSVGLWGAQSLRLDLGGQVFQVPNRAGTVSLLPTGPGGEIIVLEGQFLPGLIVSGVLELKLSIGGSNLNLPLIFGGRWGKDRVAQPGAGTVYRLGTPLTLTAGGYDLVLVGTNERGTVVSRVRVLVLGVEETVYTVISTR